MKVLAVECSSVVAGAALMMDGQLVFEGYSHHKKNHSQLLMPLVEETLAAGGIVPAEIDLFAVSIGPGSFTGLRIGTATVKGLAMAGKQPIAAIPTLDLLAANLPCYHGVICPILDARRDQVYTAIYQWEAGEHRQLGEYQAVHVSDLVDLLKSLWQEVVFLGDGVPPYQDVLQAGLGDKAFFAPPHLRHQRASAAAALALQYYDRGQCVQYRDLEPFYLRQSQAEQKRASNEGAGDQA